MFKNDKVDPDWNREYLAQLIAQKYSRKWWEKQQNNKFPNLTHYMSDAILEALHTIK